MMLLFLLACDAIYGEKTGDDTSFADDSASTTSFDDSGSIDSTGLVLVLLHVFTEESGCWAEETLELDGSYWSDYAIGSLTSCNDITMTLATTDGRCFFFPYVCGYDVLDDPLISKDKAVWAACEAAAEDVPIPNCD